MLQILDPLTFEDIFSLWVGGDNAKRMISKNGKTTCTEDLQAILGVENSIRRAIETSEIKTYIMQDVSGRELFTEITINNNHFLAVALYGDGLHQRKDVCMQKNLNLMFTVTFSRDNEKIVYFDSAEVFHKFPFLQAKAIEQQERPLPATEAHAHTIKKKYTRGAISARDTALLFGVSPREIQNWDAGIRTPHGYPGRNNILVLKKFAMQWDSQKNIENIALGINHPVSGGGAADASLDRYAYEQWGNDVD